MARLFLEDMHVPGLALLSMTIRRAWWLAADLHRRKLEEEVQVRKVEAEDAKAHAAVLERASR